MKKLLNEIKSWPWKRLMKHCVVMIGLQLLSYTIIIYFGGSIELMKPFFSFISFAIAVDFAFLTNK